MVPSIEARIFQAIKARVLSLPMAASYEPVWTSGETSLETGAGAEYKPSPTKAYLRCTWTPNQSQRPFVGSSETNTRPGVLQIDVMGTKAQGGAVAREIAGQVAVHFPTDMRLTFMGAKVRVLKDPSVYRPFIDAHIQVPVEIQLAFE